MHAACKPWDDMFVIQLDSLKCNIRRTCISCEALMLWLAAKQCVCKSLASLARAIRLPCCTSIKVHVYTEGMHRAMARWCAWQ